MQQDSSEQIGGVPAQRTEAPPPPVRTEADTVILPAFVTGRKERPPKPAEPVRHQATPEGKLPAGERGMLVFVAALLGIGTLAIIALLGLGGFSRPAPAATRTPSVAAVNPPVPSPTPSSSPSPTPAASSASPTPPRRTPAGPVVLGTLTSADPAAFCTYSRAGRARQQDDGSWFCTGSRERPGFPFGPNDVCRWRFLDNTAYAVTNDPTDPATWRCYT